MHSCSFFDYKKKTIYLTFADFFGILYGGQN